MAGDTEQLLKALERMEEKITTKINNNIDQKFDCLQKELQDMKILSEDQEKRMSLIEKQLREKNLLFFGISEGEKSYEELENKIVETINKNMEIDCSYRDIEIVHRVGKKDTGKIRPVKVTFVRLGTKIKILKCKKGFESLNIYVKHDYPQKVLEIRKNLQEQVKKEREQGNQAILRYDKLIVTKRNEKPLTNSRSNFVQKRPLNITPPNTKHTEENRNEHNTFTETQHNKKNKTMSYGIRHFMQNKNTESMTPDNQ
ncbi:putative leucine-rich repeat-containing protein DDB_G0290503 [Pararge aegeria]|uniref:putative leucine-rich repeat-containing protein DDB_G0290503 n=1 Tax=Pararge aegeria TaxID=116150 RepID=UPI0019D0F7CB|nr:putative leucine-rich repeat-containing protein DDB_G0290503 [Pararge aegeria]